VYVIRCTDGTHYTGITNNLLRRMIEHVHTPSYYMRTHQPHRLLYTYEYPTRVDAALAERSIKRLGAKRFLLQLRFAHKKI
jgi:predicted GIY-YIG superfamily endonuclease